MENRQQFASRYGFIMAAVGSAVGLGNIWRFPAVAYENGGGAFLIPYLIALLTAGIPLLILEFTMGHKYRGSGPLSYFRMNKGAEWLGWWQVLVAFVISTYYAVIIAWALSYTVFSFDLKWGDKPDAFLVGEYLKVADPGVFGSLVPGVLIPLLIVWIVTIAVLFKGVAKGIEKLNKIFLPLLFIMFTLIVIRAITLDGAAEGLNAFFEPRWDLLTSGKVWVAAYGQIFFSLSIAFAIMITYSSYLPKKSDINNNAFITGFANSGFELLAGIGVFAALGFMAQQQGVPVDEVVKSGIGLAFMVFPSIINSFPGLNEVFGVLFFLSLVFAGMTSLISIVEVYVAALQDKFSISRSKAVLFGGLVSALFSLIYASNGGLNFLDIVDHFINTYGIVLSGLIEVILIGWVFKKLGELQNHANSLSDLRTGSWWVICLKFVTPVLLGYMLIQLVITEFKEPYGGYPVDALIKYGAVTSVTIILLGVLLSFLKWDKNKTAKEHKEAM
ncbi:sodium-dependent transporter [Fictibacillus iocasae]|uniref:Sodium-dependent transporter n=1 Tax=Fictibacillus iocasae TaxID=2715437 RepID=A0ABW2NNW1_9BACL